MFYIKKSINVGPLRFNLSKSGIGTSVGIKGFRIGSGPKGNYVHMGKNGLYYRKSLPRITKANDSNTHFNINKEDLKKITHQPLQDIESADILQLTDSSSAELIQEINSKNSKISIFNLAIILSTIFFFLLKEYYLFVIPIILLSLVIARYLDITRKSVVLFYDLEKEVQTLFEQLHNSFENLINASRTWHIEASGNVTDRKYHAGANQLIRRKKVILNIKEPAYLKTNITVPVIPVGKQSLYFFPDRVLVYEGNKVGAVSYKNLQIDISLTNFVEDDGVPSDSRIVGQTWRYINKNGGPDKRFSNNKQIPIVEYEKIHLTSPSGLNELLNISKVGSSINFVENTKSLANFD